MLCTPKSHILARSHAYLTVGQANLTVERGCSHCEQCWEVERSGSGVRGVLRSGVRVVLRSGVRGVLRSGVRGVLRSGVRGVLRSGVTFIEGCPHVRGGLVPRSGVAWVLL